MTLKDIALELLQKYHDDEIQLIHEFHGDPEKGKEELQKEVDHYRMLIEEAGRNEGPEINKG